MCENNFQAIFLFPGGNFESFLSFFWLDLKFFWFLKFPELSHRKIFPYNLIIS